MIEILGQLTLGEGAGVAVGGGAITLAALKLAGLLLNKGGLHAKLDVGAPSNGNGVPKECPLHAPLVKSLDEREANRQRDHLETVQEIRDMKTAMMTGFTRVHDRIDQFPVAPSQGKPNPVTP